MQYTPFTPPNSEWLIECFCTDHWQGENFSDRSVSQKHTQNYSVRIVSIVVYKVCIKIKSNFSNRFNCWSQLSISSNIVPLIASQIKQMRFIWTFILTVEINEHCTVYTHFCGFFPSIHSRLASLRIWSARKLCWVRAFRICLVLICFPLLFPCVYFLILLLF